MYKALFPKQIGSFLLQFQVNDWINPDFTQVIIKMWINHNHKGIQDKCLKFNGQNVIYYYWDSIFHYHYYLFIQKYSR